MKELEKFSDYDLQSELRRREEERLEEEAKKLPEKILPYKEVDSIELDEKSRYFLIHIDEGSEGFDYIVRYRYNDYHHPNVELIGATIRHEVITSAIKGGWDDNLRYFDVIQSEISPYAIPTFIEIDGRVDEK